MSRPKITAVFYDAILRRPPCEWPGCTKYAEMWLAYKNKEHRRVQLSLCKQHAKEAMEQIEND